MNEFTLHELACFDAVVAEGSFQAAAAFLHRTHPAVFAAVKSIEARIGTPLFDRTGYRVQLTVAGKAFREKAKDVLSEARALQTFAEHLALGEETELRVVVGDLCPTTKVVRLLHKFSIARPHTRLHLHFEALTGPWERLFDGDADLIIHHVDKADAKLEWKDLFPVTLVPVVAPGFLPFAVTRTITPKQMKAQVQCIIRDSARKPTRDYFVVEGGQSWTVSDQLMKKELIALGMGWGHMPLHLIERDLRSGKLLSIEGKHFKRSNIDIVIARLRKRPAGPVAERLWTFLGEAQA
jgi:DNA-binding transcriptional LysR family regulator